MHETIVMLFQIFPPYGNVLRVIIRHWSNDQGRYIRRSFFADLESSEIAKSVVEDKFTTAVIVDGQEFERTVLTEPISGYTDSKMEEKSPF